jgi:hypothetical protein
MQIVSDAVLALALFGAVAIVFVVDRAHAPEHKDNQVELVVDEPPPDPVPIRRLRLGVTPREPEYDDMGKLLDSLGDGYRYTAFDLDDLLEPGKLAEYDVVFLTCGGFTDRWLAQRVGDADRGGGGLFMMKPEALEKSRSHLRKFVRGGGTLYASDLRFPVVSSAFHEFVEGAQAEHGAKQQVEAEIVDPGLKELLGSHLLLTFDQPGWFPAYFAGKGVSPLIRGSFKLLRGGRASAPLLVKFPFGEGAVIFTSFHNEKQNDEAETKLLRHLVFSAVTAKVEAQVAKTMVRGGFSPAKQGLYSASQGQPAATQVYHCTKTADLQFVLGFDNAGARLRLNVVGPDGKTAEKEGTSTIVIDIPAAAVGDWNYTVTAISLPNENFPFTVTVGQK